MEKLKFSPGNAKLSKKIFSLSLSAGHSCPFAKDCLSYVDLKTGKITDGPNTKFRCFSASQEAQYPSTFQARWHNFSLLRKLKKDQMVELIKNSMPEKAELIRIHVAGDFFNQDYFDAWIAIAKLFPGKIFYAYTKSLPYWMKRVESIPANFMLTASKGGKKDELIEKLGLKYAEVVLSEEEAEMKGLEIDHDDSHAYEGKDSFALLIHGTQPAGSLAGQAKAKLKKEGWSGYQRNTKKEVEQRLAA